jgi:hypothetical protein
MNKHPAARRTYVFRGMVRCGCGRLMAGNGRTTRTYYTCWPKADNRGRETSFAGHPKSVYLREDLILDAVSAFLADRLFGPHRRELFADGLTTVDDHAARQRDRQRERLRRTIEGSTHRQVNVLRQAQDCEPGDPFANGLRESYNVREVDRQTPLAQLHQESGP